MVRDQMGIWLLVSANACRGNGCERTYREQIIIIASASTGIFVLGVLIVRVARLLGLVCVCLRREGFILTVPEFLNQDRLLLLGDHQLVVNDL